MPKNSSVIVMFYDLPVKEGSQMRGASKFRNELLKNGFTVVQKSVYAKLIYNRANANDEIQWARDIAPKEGEISALVMSLAEFKNMHVILGQGINMRIFSDDVVEV